MTPLLHPALVNDRFGDPALYVEFLFEKRALLFDLGDLGRLSPRKILRLSDVFVSHAHMDHFIGFDRLLRVLLGRDKHLRLYGPAGFAERIGHRLAGYAWNLGERYRADLTFTVTELHAPSAARRARFALKQGFRRQDLEPPVPSEGVLRDEEALTVTAAILDHRIPCLAFAAEEKAHVNVWKNRLEALGLPTGPWLRELKRAVVRGYPEDESFRVWWREGGGIEERSFPLGRLKREVLEIVPGQKIAYVVDALANETNAARIVELAGGADLLYIEAAFVAADAARAADRYHLTTAQAGSLARRAGVRRVEPFHFSPRYAGREDCLRREVETAFRG